MAYGKNTKPLLVGFPSNLKDEIKLLAEYHNLSEAEVVRRLVVYVLNSPLDKAIALK